MGCKISAVGPAEHSLAPSYNSFSVGKTLVEHDIEWKLLPTGDQARRAYIEEGTLFESSSDSELEFRILLDNPYALKCFARFLKKRGEPSALRCWIDFQELRITRIENESYRKIKASDIYETYVRPEGTLSLEFLTPEDRDELRAELFKAIDQEIESAVFSPLIFEKLQYKCFTNLHANTFLAFKNSEDYRALSAGLSKVYNRVTMDDFVFYSKLGEGGFGVVVECEKISTQIRYAMKIQRKQGLLRVYKDRTKVCQEKEIAASIQHPFIVSLTYAFQTETLVMMVMDLSTNGDLFYALSTQPGNRFSEDRTRIYTAELVLAINYLHQRGFIYRDLKPNNVLLGPDGHILLLDLGGVAHLDEMPLYPQGQLPLLSYTDVAQLSGDSSHGNISEDKWNNHKQFDVVGTVV
jgi:hypothetical protein